MKKIILLITTLFILTGCTNQNTNNIQEDTQTNNETMKDLPTIKEDIYVDDNPIKVALYQNGKKVTTYSSTFADGKDLAVFDIYYTDIDKVSSTNTKKNYQKYLNEYENIEEYKNGFYITFEADGKQMESLILDARGTYSLEPYMYVYLYDDINQAPNTYYTHLKKSDMNENTIISSIKLYLAYETHKISSPISITAFTYNGDEDFTEENKYRGISSYTVEINKK